MLGNGARLSLIRRRLVAICSLGIALVWTAAAPAATIRDFGRYSLARLGATTIHMTGTAAARGRGLAFTLPQGAHEGPGQWYVLHLHAHVDVAAGTPPGKLYLDAGVGGYPAVKVAIVVPRGDAAIQWSTLGELDGLKRHTSMSRSLDIRTSNVMPFRSVAPGRNVLSFATEQYAGARIDSVTIDADTAIEYTKLGPGRLTVSASTNRSMINPGDRVIATVDVANAGDRRVGSIVISAMAAGAPLTLEGRSIRRRGSLGPGKRLYESFAFTAKRPGHTQIFFFASSSANRPATEVEVTTAGATGAQPAAARPPNHDHAILIGIAAGVCALLVALIAVHLRNRRV